MARPEAIEKLLFFPTPDPLLDQLARQITILNIAALEKADQRSDWLDPCAGEGAIRNLYDYMTEHHRMNKPAARKTVRLHGIEIDAKRATITDSKGIRTIHAGYEEVHIAPESISLVLNNPPYNARKGGRMEHDFLKRVTGHLRPRGILIHIVSRQHLETSATWLAKEYNDIKLLELPPEIDDRFDQVALIAQKISQNSNPFHYIDRTEKFLKEYARREIELDDENAHSYSLPWDTSAGANYYAGTYYVPTIISKRRIQFVKRTVNHDALLAETHADTAPASKILQLFNAETRLGKIEMLTPPREDQVKILAAAGLAHNDIMQAADGHTHLLKCTTTKKIEEVTETDDDEKTYRETVNTAYCYFDCDTGKYTDLQQTKSEDSSSAGEQLNTYIADNAESFTEMVLKNINQIVDIPNYKDIKPLPLELDGKMRAYGKQMQAINLTTHALKTKGFAILGVQLGGGKTIMSVSAARQDKNKSILIGAPATITKKWAAELNEFYNPNYSCPSIIRIDTDTINNLKMKPEFPDPSQWLSIINAEWPDTGLQTTWLTETKGVLELDFKNYPNVSYTRKHEPKINGKAIIGRINTLLRHPHIEINNGRVILTHDWNPIHAKYLHLIQQILPEDTHAYILDAETYRIEYGKTTLGVGEKEGETFKYLKRKLEDIVPGSRWNWIDYNTIDGTRKRPVSKTPLIYLMEQAKKMSKIATLQTPHYTIISHSMLQGTFEYGPAVLGGDHRYLPKRKRPAYFNKHIYKPMDIKTVEDEDGNSNEIITRKPATKTPTIWDGATRVSTIACCPECFTPLHEKKDDDWNIVRATDTHDALNAFAEWLEKVTVKKRARCHECNTKLYAPNAKKKNGLPNIRLSIDEYMKRKMKGVYDLFIFDEVQKSKAGDTAIGQSTGILMNLIRKKLVLTGTPMNGYPSSLFFIFWRLIPEFRKLYGIHESERFSREMGFCEIQYASDEEIDDYSLTSKRYNAKDRVRHLPGFMPQVFRYILPHMVLLKVPDIATMPPLTEHVIKVQLPDDVRKAYDKMTEDYDKAIDHAKKTGAGNIMAQLRSALYHSACAYPDAPFHGIHQYYEWITNNDHLEHITIEVPRLSTDQLMPKEEALIDLIKEERKANRRVLVYAHYTGTRDFIDPEGETTGLLKRIQDEGIKSHFMRSTDSHPVDRIYRVNRLVSEDIDVLICNPKLVEVGINLLDFPTIIYYQITQETATMEQSQGRSWRIGQTEPVKIYYILYENTGQEVSMALLANKITVSQMIQGKMLTEGIGQLVVTRHDAMLLMARAITEKLQMSDVIKTAGEVDSLIVQSYDKFVGPHAANMDIDQDDWMKYDREYLDRAKTDFAGLPEFIVDVEKYTLSDPQPIPISNGHLVSSKDLPDTEPEDAEINTQMSLFDMFAAV